jgi:hypothetical protein
VGGWVGGCVDDGGGSCCGGRSSGGSLSGYEKKIEMQRAYRKEHETTETCAHVKFRCREAIPKAHTTTTTNTATTTTTTRSSSTTTSNSSSSPQVEGLEILPKAQLGHLSDFVPAQIERDEVAQSKHNHRTRTQPVPRQVHLHSPESVEEI